MTKLDVLDGLEEIKCCVGYELRGEQLEYPPADPEDFGECQPVYKSFAGWQESTKGTTQYGELPKNARAYVEAIEAFVGIPIDIISTGPQRHESIVKRNVLQ